MLAEFAQATAQVDGVRIRYACGGAGPPVLLLHGYPQTHAMWHAVAPALARRFTVVCADLRGYGDSEKPPSDPEHERYSKRAMAADQLALMCDHLGFDRFAVVGHDRGARVARRLALDHPEHVSKLALLDIIPTRYVYEHLDQARATSVWRYFFLIQPAELSERLIAADPAFYLRWTIGERGRGHHRDHARGVGRVRALLRRSHDPRELRGLPRRSDDRPRARPRRRPAARLPLLVLWSASEIGASYDVLGCWREEVRRRPRTGAGPRAFPRRRTTAGGRPGAGRLPASLKPRPACAEQGRVTRRPAFALAALVAASFIVRTALGWLRSTPVFFPDEYIYSAIGRSLADSGRPLVRGGSAHFPALLQPIVTAPAWLIGDIGTAFRVVQAIEALAMSLAAIPVYLIAVRLGLSRRIALALAALALLVPDLLYSSFVASEPFAYPLVLAAVAAGTVALAQPTRRAQIAFVVFAALGVFTRAQLAVLPAVFIVAVFVLGLVERRLRAALREQLLPLCVFLLPLAGMALAGPSNALGYYRAVLHLHLHPIVFLRWSGWDLMILAYAAGWIIVPGALLGLWFAIRRPTSRLERSFAVVVLLLSVALVGEAGLLQANGVGRPGFPVTEIKERYVFYVVPLFGICFALYAKRGWPARVPHLLLAAAFVILSVRVPLSGFAVAATISASPILLGVYWLTAHMGGPGNAAVVVVAVVGLLSVVAVLASRRPRLGTPVVLGLALLAATAASAGAVIFDVQNTAAVKRIYLPGNPSWVDRAHVGKVTLLQSFSGARADSLQMLFWNRSITRVVMLPGSHRFDSFKVEAARIARDGSLTVNGRPLDGPLLVTTFGSKIRLRGAHEVGSGPTATLWVPDGSAQPRLQLYALGFYHDGWLANAGVIDLWPSTPGRQVSGWLSARLTTPLAYRQTVTLTVRSESNLRRIALRPGHPRTLRIRVCAPERARVTYRSDRLAVAGGRAVSVKATAPTFTPSASACPSARS